MAQATCSIEGCERPVNSRGMCGLHYQRWKRTGDAGEADYRRRPKAPPADLTECAVDNCTSPVRSRGWCMMHYQRWQTKGDPLAEPPTVIEKVWRHIARQPSGCWEWNGLRGPLGYGRAYGPYAGRRRWPAHRLVYSIMVEPIPEGMVVRHRCDNPPCVNPAHLELGTIADNNADRTERGRSCRTSGQDRWVSKLTDDDVRAARRMLADGLSQHAVGEALGVSQTTIWAIKSGNRWSHVL